MQPKPVAQGKVTPPADMDKAARLTLGERYADFRKKYPGEFTPKQLVDFHEDK